MPPPTITDNEEDYYGLRCNEDVVQSEWTLLSTHASTIEGRQIINRSFMFASNHEWDSEREVYVPKEKTGKGNLVAGLAFDLETLDLRCSRAGEDHAASYDGLVTELANTSIQTGVLPTGYSSHVNYAEDRAMQAWAYLVPDWKCAWLIACVRSIEESQLERLRDGVLRLGIGLPLFYLFNKYEREFNSEPVPVD